ncbi:MAG: hypothetical protein ACREJE_10700, partial [Candidatus Rokuibacteriota bacterium]
VSTSRSLSDRGPVAECTALPREGAVLRPSPAEGIAAAGAGVKSHLAPRQPTAAKKIPSFATSW